jgi:hypothetical protein
MLSIKRRPQGAIMSVAACAAALLLFAAPSSAATTEVYPTGGGTFQSDLQGWQVTEATCNLPLICTASGAHDASAGNPAGSASAKTTVILGLINLITSTIAFESPQFTVTKDGTATLSLDRQFVPSQVAVPGATYTVTLKDVTAGTDDAVHTEELTAASPTFVGQEVAADVTAGHTYAIVVEAETSATVELGVLGGANLRFDNVALSVEIPDPPADPPTDPPGDDDGNDDEKSSKDDSSSKSSKNSSSSEQTVQQGTTTGVVQNGRRVLVKLSCPARAKKSCRITAQGKLKGKSVTKRRTVKVAKGKSRIVSLAVKPRFRETVAEQKRLLIVQKVKTGKKTRTFTRSRPLIQRG